MSGNVVCVGIHVDDVQYHGSALDRKERGYRCEVVSSSSIPRRAGKRVKSDRIMAAMSGMRRSRTPRLSRTGIYCAPGNGRSSSRGFAAAHSGTATAQRLELFAL